MSVAAGITPSPLEELVVDSAIDEALLRDTSLILVSHVASPRSREDALEHIRERESRMKWLESHAARARQRGVAEVELVLPTSPENMAGALLEVDKRADVRLLVIGIPRRSRVGKALIGSSSQEVLLHSDSPVLGVKLPSDERT